MKRNTIHHSLRNGGLYSYKLEVMRENDTQRMDRDSHRYLCRGKRLAFIISLIRKSFIRNCFNYKIERQSVARLSFFIDKRILIRLFGL